MKRTIDSGLSPVMNLFSEFIYKKFTSNVVVVESVTRTRGLVFENVAQEFFSAGNSWRRSFPLYACRVMLSNGERERQENLASSYIGYFYRTAFTNGLVSCSAIFSGIFTRAHFISMSWSNYTRSRYISCECVEYFAQQKRPVLSR